MDKHHGHGHGTLTEHGMDMQNGHGQVHYM
jgi:hypothetical protein